MILNKSDENSADICVETLKKGGVVIIPTDTVYGFSAVCGGKNDGDARIKKIKGRAETKPFIKLIGNPDDIFKYTDDKIPEKLLKYWPGPLTIIVNNKKIIENFINSTAFRCPGDEWLREIINKLGSPIYSTSVNRSGSPVLDTEEAVINEFEKDADLIVLDGDKKNALPSTIVSVLKEKPEILRQGSLKINL